MNRSISFVFVYASGVDILADQLAQARARGAVFSVLRRVAPWGLRFGGQRPLTAHCLLDGDGWLEQPGRPALRLHARDMVLMTAGPPYAIVSDRGTAGEPIAEARRRGSDDAAGETLLAGPPPAGTATILCGAYVLDGSVAASLLGSLPRAVVVAAADQEPAHAAAVALLAGQISRDAPGQQTLLDRLLDLNLVFALRAWWAAAGGEAPGWYRALSDPGLRRALEHVHAEPGGDWTVPVLADLAGLSRAAFAARFRQVTGQSPGAYVTGVRMQRAEDELTRSDATLAEIAGLVGYRNEYAFATAFRRRHARSPRANGGPLPAEDPPRPGSWPRSKASSTRRASMDLGRYGVFSHAAVLTPERVRHLEALGYGTVWQGGSPPAALSDVEAMLDATTTLKVATGIVNVWSADAAEVARSYHRLEKGYPGRFLLGVGVGHPEATAAYQSPYQTLVNYLDVLDAEGVPVDRRVLAALGPRVLKLSAARSAGAHPYWSPRNTPGRPARSSARASCWPPSSGSCWKATRSRRARSAARRSSGRTWD